MVKVLVVGQVPPPFLGQPIMLLQLLQSNIADVELQYVRMALSSDGSEVGRFRWGKVLSLLPIVMRVVFARMFGGAKILYYQPAGPLRVTMFRDFAVLIPIRWMFSKVIFHFQAGGLTDLYPRLPAWQRWLFRRAYFHPDAVIRLSELTPQDGRQLHARREYVIANAVVDPCPAGLPDRAPFAISEQQPLRLLFVAMLRESKGVLVLIEAAARLKRAGVPFRLEIMGQFISPEFADRVHARVAELELTDQITFLGMLTGDAKFAAFARADVFCMPTFYESEAFPVALVEAMAFGLPIVSTEWRGIPSIVADGETGFLVATRDPEAVADRLTTLAEDPQLRFEMGQSARERFAREFVWPVHVAQMREMFLEVAGVITPATKLTQTKSSQKENEVEAAV